jgi:hypothetical protein
LKVLLEQEGFKVAVLRASVDASRREDWIAEQLDRGIDVLITNPELVKTGLDLLEFRRSCSCSRATTCIRCSRRPGAHGASARSSRCA